MKQVLYTCEKCKINRQYPFTKEHVGPLYPFVFSVLACGQCGRQVLVRIVEKEK